MSVRRPGVDRKREIADAALQVIAREGLGRFTASSLAGQVGLTNGALFRHFASMDAIVLAAIDRAEEVLFAGFPPNDEDPIDRLGAFFCLRISAIRRHPDVMRAVYSNELAQAAGQPGAARVREFKKRSVKFVRACLEEAARRELLTAHGTPKELAVLVLGAIMALALLPEAGASSAKGPAPEEVWAALERMLRARCTHPPA